MILFAFDVLCHTAILQPFPANPTQLGPSHSTICVTQSPLQIKGKCKLFSWWWVCRVAVKQDCKSHVNHMSQMVVLCIERENQQTTSWKLTVCRGRKINLETFRATNKINHVHITAWIWPELHQNICPYNRLWCNGEHLSSEIHQIEKKYKLVSIKPHRSWQEGPPGLQGVMGALDHHPCTETTTTITIK